MTLSDEGKRLMMSAARRILIYGGAGTGKTHMLEAYARCRPETPVLFVTYDTAVLQAAIRRLPGNVYCRTAHSIGLSAAIRQFGKSKDLKIGDMHLYDVAKRFGVNKKATHAGMTTLTAWMTLADLEIGVKHLPQDAEVLTVGRTEIIALARDISKAMANKEDISVKMPHDRYFKLFQLSQPIISPAKGKLPYEVILCDDVQDCTDVLLDILANQPCKVVCVGDKNLNLIRSRGRAVPAAKFQAYEEYHLARSFRLGQQIADLKNSLLGYFKEGHEPLIGREVCQIADRTVDETKSFAVISRTNAGLFVKAKSYLDRQVDYHFIGVAAGGKVAATYRFNTILDAYHLCSGALSEVHDRVVRRFKLFEKMEKVARQTDDRETLCMCMVVSSYQHRIPVLMEQILARHVDLQSLFDPDFTGVYLTKAHRAKGLQFRQVLLTGDHVPLVIDSSGPMAREEVDSTR